MAQQVHRCTSSCISSHGTLKERSAVLEHASAGAKAYQAKAGLRKAAWLAGADAEAAAENDLSWRGAWGQLQELAGT